jgi:hypothetical protein
MLLLDEFHDENKDVVKTYHAVLFSVSHSGTFKSRTRSVIRMAYEKRFVVTEKQGAALMSWVMKAGDTEEDEDYTTVKDEELSDSDDDGYCIDDDY